MKKISLLLLAATFSVATVFGQDTATQQQLDKLSGQIQDLTEAQAQQGKRIDDLEKQISDLAEKVNTPQVNNSASADDLKSLAEKVQEIDKKRQSDKELIIKQIESLGSTGGGSTKHSHPTANTTPDTGTDTGTATATPGGPQKGYYYTVQQGDMLSAIAKAYRDKGVKVTTTQILKANAGLDANKLYSGKKIFIPDPNAP